MAKGIAAIMDSLFLIIVALIASGIVYFAAMNYGSGFDFTASQVMTNYYAKQALRVLIMASVEREDGTPDYLFSYLKEYLSVKPPEEGILEGEIENKMMEVVKKVMAPMRGVYDFIFMIDASDTTKKSIWSYAVLTSDDGSKAEFYGNYTGSSVNELLGWLNSLDVPLYASESKIYVRICEKGVEDTMCENVPVYVRLVLIPRASVEVSTFPEPTQ